MQALPLPPVISPEQRTTNSTQYTALTHTVTRSVFTENLSLSTGSCCDNGRYIFANCGNWWYNCPK